MPVLLVEAELGLNGGAVDAEAMETLPGPTSQLHVLLTTMRIDGERNLDMHAGDELGVGELPDVNVMAGNNTRECLDVLANLGNADMLRGGLEKDSCGTACERNASLENDGGNEQRDSGIGIILSRPVGKPDNQSGSHNTNVAKHIADDVKNHGVHTHVIVTVAMTALLARLLRQCVVVTVVNTRVSASSRGVRMRMRFDKSRLRGIDKSAVPSDTLEKRRFLVRLFIGHQRGFGIVTVAGGLSHGRGDDILSEACRVNANIFEVGESRMSTPTGSAIMSAPRMRGMSVASAGLLSGVTMLSCAADNNLGRNVASIFMTMVSSMAFLFVVSVVVRVAMSMIVSVVVVIVIVSTRSVRMAVATENEETDKVGKETGATNNEHELGVVDLRRLNESGQGFEDDGDAERDEEDGVEEGT